MIRHTHKFARERSNVYAAYQFAASYENLHQWKIPLIMSPWHYPFLLNHRTISGCDCGRKYSNYQTKRPIRRQQCYYKENYYANVFQAKYVAVVTGRREMQRFWRKNLILYFLLEVKCRKEVLRHTSETF